MSDLLMKRPVGRSDDSVPLGPFMGFEYYARNYYKEGINYSPEHFVRMLVADSSFIIRILLSFLQEIQEIIGFLDVNIPRSAHLLAYVLRSDLLLLENQIPLFFIEKVYDWFSSQIPGSKFPPFHTILEPFLFMDMPWKFNHSGISREADRLLDLYWRCSADPEMIKEKEFSGRQSIELTLAEVHLADELKIPNAAILHQMVDIKFEKLNDELQTGLKVLYHNGVMQMPCLKIDSSQTRLLVNLIAFENSMPYCRIFSSYVKLMDALINSEKDVELLQRCGVIYNTLSSHEVAATFFNDVGNFCLFNEMIYENFPYYFSLYNDVQKYYNSKWNCRWASLRHNYCSSAWARISVLAGTTLLILTALQTVYTILGYYHRL